MSLQSNFARMCRISTRTYAAPSLSSGLWGSSNDSSSSKIFPKPEIPKIRRPLSPFAVFIQSQYSKLKNENPNSKATDVMKLASGLYAKLPQEEKRKLIDAALSDRQRYEADMKGLTEEQRNSLMAFSQKKRESKALKQRRRMWRASGRPVRPLNAPLLFMKERWSDRGARKVTDFVRDLMAEWRTLPEEQKQKYRDVEAEAKRKFEIEHTAWQTKMALEGGDDRVKKQSKKSTGKASKS